VTVDRRWLTEKPALPPAGALCSCGQRLPSASHWAVGIMSPCLRAHPPLRSVLRWGSSTRASASASARSRSYSSRPPPPQRRPPPPPPRGAVVPVARTVPAVVPPGLTGGDEGSHAWNVLYLFSGLGFAGWVFSQVPRVKRVDRARGQPTVPCLPSVDEIRHRHYGHIFHACVRQCHLLMQDGGVDRPGLCDAIYKVQALNVAGTGLETVLDEILHLENGAETVGDSDNDDDDNPSGSGLSFLSFQAAMQATELCAEQLASANLLSFDMLPADWTAAHSVLLVCLVVRACGISDDEEILQTIVRPLEFQDGCDTLLQDMRAALRAIDDQDSVTGLEDDFLERSSDASYEQGSIQV
jgi:hypothetical protein